MQICIVVNNNCISYLHCHPHELDLQNFVAHTLTICPAHMTMIDTRYNSMSQKINKLSNILQSIHNRIHQLVQHSNPILIWVG
jgi:hypothetical protein